jgi:hypothetical protein
MERRLQHRPPPGPMVRQHLQVSAVGPISLGRVGLLQPPQIPRRTDRDGQHAGVAEQEAIFLRAQDRDRMDVPQPWRHHLGQPRHRRRPQDPPRPIQPPSGDRIGPPQLPERQHEGSRITSQQHMQQGRAGPRQTKPTSGSGTGAPISPGWRWSSSSSRASVRLRRTSSLRSQTRPNGVRGALAASASSTRSPGSSPTTGRPSRRDARRRTSCSSTRPSESPARSSASCPIRAAARTHAAGRKPPVPPIGI